MYQRTRLLVLYSLNDKAIGLSWDYTLESFTQCRHELWFIVSWEMWFWFQLRNFHIQLGVSAQVISLGLYSLSCKTSYRKISWSLKAARFRFKLFQSLWNLAGTSAAALPRCLSNFRAILPLQHPISRLRDFTRFGGKTSYRLVNRGPGMNARGPRRWYVHTGSSNGLLPWCNKPFTWANVDPDLCHHVVSLGHNDLNGGLTIVLKRKYSQHMAIKKAGTKNFSTRSSCLEISRDLVSFRWIEDKNIMLWLTCIHCACV